MNGSYCYAMRMNGELPNVSEWFFMRMADTGQQTLCGRWCLHQSQRQITVNIAIIRFRRTVLLPAHLTTFTGIFSSVTDRN